MGKKRKKKKVLLSGSDPFYLSKKLRRRRYGEVSAQTSQKSQNRALVKKKVAYRAPAAQACTPPTWTINRIFSKSEILAESLQIIQKKKKKTKKKKKFINLKMNTVVSPFLAKGSLVLPLSVCAFFILLFEFLTKAKLCGRKKKGNFNRLEVHLHLLFYLKTRIGKVLCPKVKYFSKKKKYLKKKKYFFFFCATRRTKALRGVF